MSGIFFVNSCQNETPERVFFRFGGTTLSLEPTAKRQFILSEQEKTPCYGVFSTRYPTKQGVCQVATCVAKADDYAAGADRKRRKKMAFNIWRNSQNLNLKKP